MKGLTRKLRSEKDPVRLFEILKTLSRTYSHQELCGHNLLKRYPLTINKLIKHHINAPDHIKLILPLFPDNDLKVITTFFKQVILAWKAKKWDSQIQAVFQLYNLFLDEQTRRIKVQIQAKQSALPGTSVVTQTRKHTLPEISVTPPNKKFKYASSPATLFTSLSASTLPVSSSSATQPGNDLGSVVNPAVCSPR